MRRSSIRQAGFTLLETVVAMAILALALMAIFDLNAGAVSMHAYTKKLTVASLLARSKMTDIEQKLYDEGMPADDDELDGDFSEEGWPSFKWRAKIIAPKTQNLPPEQLLSAVFNIPMGGGDEGQGSGTTDPLSALGGLFTGGAGTAANAQGASGMAGALGPMAGLAQGQFTQLVDTITRSVREVHLTVYWKEGKQVESIDVVTHVVSMGPGSDRNGSVSGPAGATNGNTANPLFDLVTGMPCQNGQSPAGNPCGTAQQYAASHGGAMPPGASGGLPGGGAPLPGLNIPNRPPFGPLTPLLRPGAAGGILR